MAPAIPSPLRRGVGGEVAARGVREARRVVSLSAWRGPGSHPGLFTDMYHPDAAYVSWVSGRNGVATFDLYARVAPFGGAYMLVAGLEAALEFVQAFHYAEKSFQKPTTAAYCAS